MYLDLNETHIKQAYIKLNLNDVKNQLETKMKKQENWVRNPFGVRDTLQTLDLTTRQSMHTSIITSANITSMHDQPTSEA